jgi:hypothetical protein
VYLSDGIESASRIAGRIQLQKKMEGEGGGGGGGGGGDACEDGETKSGQGWSLMWRVRRRDRESET